MVIFDTTVEDTEFEIVIIYNDTTLGWSYSIDQFPLEVGDQTIYLEPVFFVNNDLQTITIEMWTDIFEWFDEVDNFEEKLEESSYVSSFVRMTEKFKGYSENPQKELKLLYELWSTDHDKKEMGQIILQEELKQQVLERVKVNIGDWEVMILQDHPNFDSYC